MVIRLFLKLGTSSFKSKSLIDFPCSSVMMSKLLERKRLNKICIKERKEKNVIHLFCVYLLRERPTLF